MEQSFTSRVTFQGQAFYTERGGLCAVGHVGSRLTAIGGRRAHHPPKDLLGMSGGVGIPDRLLTKAPQVDGLTIPLADPPCASAGQLRPEVVRLYDASNDGPAHR
jgi:hypothetical protein